ncbi:MAG: DUF4157 domain-containing protein [bacterium]|nr:DUF4157 domain-containing protein [bacterium]
MSSDQKNYIKNKAFNMRVNASGVAQQVRRKSKRSGDPTIDYTQDLQRTLGNQGVEHLIRSGMIQPDNINRQINITPAQEAKSALASVIAMKNYSLFSELNSKGLFGDIQTKMTVGGANDIYEQEADRVADAVVSMSDADIQQKSNNIEIQGKGASNGAFTVGSNVESGIRSMKGGGQSLSTPMKRYYHARFDRDFSNVRVHTGDKAHKLTKAINARAFTTGNDVFFARGEFSPDTKEGKKLMAHELTHVVQQKGGIKKKSPEIQLKHPATAKKNDITASFVGILNSAAKEMKKSGYFRDWVAAPWTVPNAMLMSNLKKKLPNLTEKDINELVTGDVHSDLQRTPYLFREFYSKVRTGAKWDVKNGIYKKFKSGVVLAGKLYPLDVTGNVLFGFAGAASGFSGEVLTVMAGLAQKNFDIKKYGKPNYTSSSNYDDPRDQAQILMGVGMYKKHGAAVTAAILGKFLTKFGIY